MKGISTVIATLMMLLITMALAGMAYTYISGVFTSKTMTISLVDAYCAGGSATWVIRNEGSVDLAPSSFIISPVNENCTTDPAAPSISAGKTATLTATGCERGRIHVYRLRGPSNAVELSVYCT